MKCCGLERDSQFCPKCGKNLKAEPKPIRWVESYLVDGQALNIGITIYPDRHRMPASTRISFDEAKLLRDELTGMLGE